VAERFHIHTEEVEPGVFELSLEHQEGGRRLWGTRWRTVAVLARRRYLANDMFGLASYRGALEQAAGHAAAGHYGCYVETTHVRGGRVEVELIERVVVEANLRTSISRPARSTPPTTRPWLRHRSSRPSWANGRTGSTPSASRRWPRARSSTTPRWRTQPSASARRRSWRRS
jgi:hypothetical protein